MASRFSALLDESIAREERQLEEDREVSALDRPVDRPETRTRFTGLLEESRSADVPEAPRSRFTGLLDEAMEGRKPKKSRGLLGKALALTPPALAIRVIREGAKLGLKQPGKVARAIGSGILAPIAGIAAVPELLENAEATTKARILGAFGITETVDGQKVPIRPETIRRVFKTPLSLHAFVYAPIAGVLKAGAEKLSVLKEFDKTIIEMVKAGDLEGAADKTFLGVIENSPQLAMQFAAVAAGAGPLALVGLGASAAGNKFAEIKDDPEMTLEQKTDNALLTGTFESLSELITLGWMKPIVGRLGKKAVKSIVKSIFRKLSPPVVEAFQEGVAKVSENIADAATNRRNEKGELPKPFDNIGDPIIFGGILGGAGTIADIGLDIAEQRSAEPAVPPEIPPEVPPVSEDIAPPTSMVPGLPLEIGAEGPDVSLQEEAAEPVQVRPVTEFVEGKEQPTPTGLVAPEEVTDAERERVPEELETAEVEEEVEEITARGGFEDEEAERFTAEEIETANLFGQAEEIVRKEEEAEEVRREGEAEEVVGERLEEGRDVRAEPARSEPAELGRAEEVTAPVQEELIAAEKPKRKRKPKKVPEGFEADDALREFRSQMRSAGVRPPTGLTAEDFGGRLPPGILNKSGTFTWDTALETARDLGLPVSENPDPSELRDLLVGPSIRQVGPTAAEIEERAAQEPSAQERVEQVSSREPRTVSETELDIGSLVFVDNEWRKVEEDGAKGDKRLVDGETIELGDFETIEAREVLAPDNELYPFALEAFQAQEQARGRGELFDTGREDEELFDTRRFEGEAPAVEPPKKRVPGAPIPKVAAQQGEIFRQDITLDEAADQAIALYGDKVAAVKRLEGQRETLKKSGDSTKRVNDIIGQLESKPVESFEEQVAKEVFFKGDRAERTGKTETVSGREFFEVRLLEGPESGELKLIPVAAQALEKPSGIKTPQVPTRKRKEGEAPIQFSQQPPGPTEAEPTGGTVDAVEKSIAPLRKRWKNGPVNIVVLETAADAPKRIQDHAPAVGFRGAYDPAPDPNKPGEDTVYLVANKLPDAETAIFVAMHEVVGHRGVEGIVGTKQANRFYSQLANGRERDIAKYAKNRKFGFETPDDRRHAAREWLADKVAGGELNDVRKWWQKLLDMVRRAIDKIAGQSMSESNLDAIMRRAHRATEGIQIDNGVGAAPPPIPVSEEPRIPPPLPTKQAPPPIPAKPRKALEPAQEVYDKSYVDSMDFLNAGGWFEAIKKAAGLKDLNKKKDLGFLTTTIATIQWYNNKIPGLKKMWEAARRFSDRKIQVERMIWNNGPRGEGESQMALLQSFDKKFKSTYERLKERNWEKDLNAEGYWVNQKGKKQFTVMDWKVPGNELSTHESSDEAWESVYLRDKQDVIDEGFGEAAGEFQYAMRNINHRDFQQLEAEIETLRETYEVLGVRPPRVVMDGEEISIFEAQKKMGDRRGHYLPRMRGGGRLIAEATKEGEPAITKIFGTGVERKVWAAFKIKNGWDVDLRESERPSEDAFAAGNILSMNDLMQAALKTMEQEVGGELNLSEYGYESREVKFVTKKGEKETHFILVPIKDGARIGDQQFSAAKNGIKALGGKFFGTDQDNLGTDENGKPVEVWRFINPPKDFEERLSHALQFGQITEKTLNTFGRAVADHIAALVNSRGSRARKIGRSGAKGEAVRRGFEPDIVKAMIMSTRATAAGTAKRVMAKELLDAIAGTDVSWDQFLEEKGHDIGSEDFANLNPKTKNRLWDEYSAMVEDKRIDSALQPRAFKDALSYAQNMIRNQKPAERVFGMIRGVTGLWMLSGISPGAINVSAQFITMPPSMKAFAKIPLRKTLGLLKTANQEYTRHFLWSRFPEQAKKARLPKLTDPVKIKLYDDIIRRGWDSPLLNMEAMEVLQNNLTKYVNTATEAMMFVFANTERLNRGASHGATYIGIKEQHKGEWTEADHEAAMELSHLVTDNAHAVYGDVNLAQPFRGTNPLSMTARSTFLMFVTFVQNQLQLAYALGVPKTTRNAKALAWLTISAGFLGGTGASLAAIPVVLLVKAAYRAIGQEPPDDPEEVFLQTIGEMFGPPLAKIPVVGKVLAPVPERFARSGIVGIAGWRFEGIDLKGSLETRAQLPTTVVDLLGAPASMGVKVKDAWNFAAQGDYQKAAEALAPRMLAGPIRGNREYHEGLTTRGNTPIRFGDEQIKANWWATVLRYMGFNPQSVSELRQKKWSEVEVKRKYDPWRRRITARFRAMLAEDRWDRDAWIKIREEADEFNLQVVRNKYHFINQIEDQTFNRAITTFDSPTKIERERKDRATTKLEQVEISETFGELTTPSGRGRRPRRKTRPKRARRDTR